jgi:Domain of unknown function (DUF4170)
MGLIMPNSTKSDTKLLHMVFGGRVTDSTGYDFEDLKAIDFVGIFSDYQSAEKAWRSSAQRTVDDAQMKYVVVHLHRLMQPDEDTHTH